MPQDPCQDQREALQNAIEQGVLMIAAAAAAAPETLGLSILVGALVGTAAGRGITTAQRALARCLEANHLTAQAEVLDRTADQLDEELAALEAAGNAAVA